VILDLIKFKEQLRRPAIRLLGGIVFSIWMPSVAVLADSNKCVDSIHVRKGGPYPHTRDGIVFANRERLLPQAPRGSYREFTVRTPGRRDRGARRIIAGTQSQFYYTDDHYRSFKRILE
jgi:guanyl-specific ribonuclease Sa